MAKFWYLCSFVGICYSCFIFHSFIHSSLTFLLKRPEAAKQKCKKNLWQIQIKQFKMLICSAILKSSWADTARILHQLTWELTTLTQSHALVYWCHSPALTGAGKTTLGSAEAWGGWWKDVLEVQRGCFGQRRVELGISFGRGWCWLWCMEHLNPHF